MKLFAANASRALGLRIATALGGSLAPHEERDFACGEHKSRPLVDVWSEEVCIIASLHGDSTYSVNDKLCRLLFFVGALKDAGARRVVAVTPYLAYSRKDRRTKPGDPVTTRYVAGLLQSAGVDVVVTMDIHNPAALENAFRGPTVNLGTTALFAGHFHRTEGDSIDSIVAPDLGGVKATRLLVDAYAELSGKILPMAVMDKRRSEGRVSGSGMIGAIGRHALIVDDMIGGGTTIRRAARACLEAGASRVSVGATHGLFEGGASQLFAQEGIDSIAVTDTVATETLGLPDTDANRLTVIGTAGVFGDALRRLHGGSETEATGTRVPEHAPCVNR